MRLIDADALEKQAYDDVHYHAELEDWEFDTVVHYLDHAPTIDAVPVVHARWVLWNREFWIHQCSVCGHKPIFRTKFCPNCGAKMDAEQEAQR